MIEGVILATGLEPIPKEYVQAMTVPVKLTFEDQFGNEISAEKDCPWIARRNRAAIGAPNQYL
jgi:hypothetical protein